MHRKNATNLRRRFVCNLATELQIALSTDAVEQLLAEPDLREATHLCAYAVDLLDRLEGIGNGPASLALWRGFAWTKDGSPRKDFVLRADDVMSAQGVLRNRLLG
jgi:hypothetical protein